MHTLAELKFDFAAQDPLSHPKVVETLLGYVPSHRDTIIDNHLSSIIRIDQLSPRVRRRLAPLELEDGYMIAMLSYFSGDYETNVRIWEDLTPGQLRLVDYFNFASSDALSWRVSEDISRFLRPQSMTPTYAHVSPIYIYPGEDELIRPLDLNAEPIMGLDRMVEIARVAREEFFADPNLSFEWE